MSNLQILLETTFSIRERIRHYSQRITDSLVISKQKNHLLVLDGVRAAACLAVILYHITMYARIYNFWNPAGGIKSIIAAAVGFGESGVILFFLLSGFLLFLPFARALLFPEQWPSLSRFYLRRIFRIVPGYYVALFLIILFFHPDLLHAGFRGNLLQLLTFRMSFSLSSLVNGPFWTLAVEFQFYMLLPLIAWVCSLIVRRGRLNWRVTKLTCCLLILLAWGLLSRYWGLTVTRTATMSFPQHILVALKPYYYSDEGKFFECFAVGMLLAMVYTYTQNAPWGELWQKRFRRWSSWIFLAGLIILGFLSILHIYYIKANFEQYSPVFVFLNPYRQLINQLWPQWQAMGYSVCYGLCMFALLYGSKGLKGPFEWPILRWIGLISFSLYMWHVPFILVYMNVALPQFHGWGGDIKLMGALLWVLFVPVPISLTLYRWVEMPGMRLGELCIQRIAKLNKRLPVKVIKDTPAERVLSPSPETALPGEDSLEQTEPRLAKVSVD